MVGSTRSHKLVDRIRTLGWGRVFVGKPTPYPGEPWALDNGAFAAWKSGKTFDPDAFAARAASWAHLVPLFGVLPDRVGHGLESLRLSLDWLPRLPATIPWYLAVQDGMTPALLPPLVGISGLFLGGTTAFKATAWEWSHVAHDQGLRFHYARVSSPLSVRRAYECGADSCDSTQPLWSNREWSKFERAVSDGRDQIGLFS
jgi:hypothetical protein